MVLVQLLAVGSLVWEVVRFVVVEVVVVPVSLKVFWVVVVVVPGCASTPGFVGRSS